MLITLLFSLRCTSIFILVGGPNVPLSNPEYSPHSSCMMTIYTNLGFALDGDPNSQLYLVLQYYPLGLDLFSYQMPLLLRADLLLRSRIYATHVTTPPFVLPTSGKMKLCPSVPLGLLAIETLLLLVLTNETRPILQNICVCVILIN